MYDEFTTPSPTWTLVLQMTNVGVRRRRYKFTGVHARPGEKCTVLVFPPMSVAGHETTNVKPLNVIHSAWFL